MLVARISKNLLFFVVAVICFEGITAVGQRVRRSPFKKHKIIVVDSGGSSGSTGSGESGWDSGGWLQEPTPPPPPTQQHDQTIVNHHHHTIVEHHHHHHTNVPPPTPQPPPPQHHQESFRIEFSKGKGKGWSKGGKGEIEESIDETWEELEREKKKKMEQFKGDVEETFDFLAKIPETIVTEIDSFGSKIKEELEKKKQEESNKSKGISIQVWKGKGGGGGGGRRRGENSESTEVIHQHHYHEGSSEEAYRPVPQPPPPKKHYQAQSYETSIADGFVGFLDQIGTQFRVPVAEEEGYYSGEPWGGSGHGGKGKGFHWKGGRRR